MLSIRCKDRLMFSKAYNNKPRGLSHASWENRSKRPEYQLSVGERVSIHAGEQVGKSWCAWNLREEVRMMRSIENRENKGGYKKGSK